MYPHTQQPRTGKQGRIRRVATAAVLAVALAMAAGMPAWAGGTGQQGGGDCTQCGPPVSDRPYKP